MAAGMCGTSFEPVAHDHIPRCKAADIGHLADRLGLAGAWIGIGHDAAFRAGAGGVDLGGGDHDAVGILGAADLAFQGRHADVQHDRGIGVVDHRIGLAVTEGHLAGAGAELGLGVGHRHLARRHFRLHGLGHSDQEIDGGVHLDDAVAHHAAFAHGRGDGDDRANRQRAQGNDAGELGSDLQMAQQVHLALWW